MLCLLSFPILASLGQTAGIIKIFIKCEIFYEVSRTLSRPTPLKSTEKGMALVALSSITDNMYEYFKGRSYRVFVKFQKNDQVKDIDVVLRTSV